MYKRQGTQYYNDAIARTKVAMKSGTLKGILWHQGEGNSKDRNYLPKLVQLITDLRSDLGDAELPFVAGMLIDSEKRKRLNDQLKELPNQVPYTACVSSTGLTAADGTHFDTQSQLEFGKRYAAAMAKLAGNAKE